MITPQEKFPQLAEALGVSEIVLKREDLHPYRSHKGRSIPVMVDHYVNSGKKDFAISSSGNAAIAAALYVNEINTKNEKEKINLDIFVGNKIDPAKLSSLKELSSENVRIFMKERPLQALMQAEQNGVISLRQSTDDIALIGYETLASELAAVPNISAVFMGTSSGTTAEALASFFLKHKLPIQMHIVQTSSCHPIIDAFETFDVPDELSLAGAIVDKIAHRKAELVPLIEKTGGRGWLAKNDNILAAQKIVSEHTELTISANSALSIAGAMEASYMGYDIPGTVVCILGGQ